MLLAHDDLGSGPPVLLVHSGVADRRMWDPLVTPLSHAFRVVCADLRGFGETPLPPGPYADADDLDALLGHLGVTAAAVVGSSLGGRVALELATLHPGRVSSLVLLAPALRGIEATEALERFSAQEERLLEAGDVAGAVALNVQTFLGPEASAESKEALAAMQRLAFDVQLEAERQEPPPQPRRVEVDLSGVAVDTIVVAGGRDLDHFQGIAKHIAAEVPGADLVTLDWAGHLPALERPDAVLALLLDVLRDDPAVHAP